MRRHPLVGDVRGHPTAHDLGACHIVGGGVEAPAFNEIDPPATVAPTLYAVSAGLRSCPLIPLADPAAPG